MKKLILSIATIISLTSCSDFIDVRVRTIQGNDIIIIDADRSVFNGYKEGDTIQISKSGMYSWEIENRRRVKDEFRVITYKNRDSIDVTFTVDYKQAIIEEIDCKTTKR